MPQPFFFRGWHATDRPATEQSEGPAEPSSTRLPLSQNDELSAPARLMDLFRMVRRDSKHVPFEERKTGPTHARQTDSSYHVFKSSPQVHCPC